MFAAPPEKPLSVGDLIGYAFRVYRPHIPLFLKVLIGPTIISTFGALGIQWAIDNGLSAANQNKDSMSTCLLVLMVGLLAFILAKWILAVRQLAFVRLSTGFCQDVTEALSYVNKRKWHVLALFIALFIVLFVAIISWAITVAFLVLVPKAGLVIMALKILLIALSTLALLAAIAFSLFVTSISLSIIACEQQSLFDTINRSIKLTKADLWRSLGFAGLLVVSLSAISYPLTLPVVLLSIADVCTQSLSPEGISESYHAPFYLLVLSEIWESFANMLIWPIMFLAYGLFYYDLRLRQEGLDIVRRLEALEKQS